MRALTPFDAFAVLLILVVWSAAMIVTWTRAKPRKDAGAERANADRRSLSSGAAKPLFHDTPFATGGQHDHVRQ